MLKLLNENSIYFTIKSINICLYLYIHTGLKKNMNYLKKIWGIYITSNKCLINHHPFLSQIILFK